MVTIPEKQEEGDPGLPPAYTPESESGASDTTYTDAPPPIASPSSSSSFTPAPPLAPPTNFLTISRQNNSIKGVYTIDPSLPMPPGATPSPGADGAPLHMLLNSHNGSVDAVVELVRSGDVKGPARLEAGSKNGSVTVTVHDTRLMRFRLRAASHNGAVTLHLPRTFTGPLSTMLKNGKLVFSAAVQARLTTISEQGSEGRFFVGDFAGAGYAGEEGWLGDAVRVEAHNGRVKVDFVGENGPGGSVKEGKGKGFFGKFLG